MAKRWLQQRWDILLPALEQLTVEQEEEIARLCAAEIAAWKARPTMKSLSSLKEPMTDTRNAIRQVKLTAYNSYLNLRTREREHLALKYMNYSESEWAAMEQETEDRFQRRMEHQLLLDRPMEVVERARGLLTSSTWPEIVVGLALLTGRRLSEILKAGELHPCTLHTVIFGGALKRADVALKPYEIPVLAPASEILAAWSRVHQLVDCSQMEVEAIGKMYSNEVADVADRHFGALIPAREGRTRLFAHLFRAVYPRLAVYWFCPVNVSDIHYVPTILGHYWAATTTEMQQRNYMSSLHYNDYRIGDGKGNIDGRQGIRLGEPGVEVLCVFRPKPEKVETRSRAKKKERAQMSPLETKKDHSILRVNPGTKSRFESIHQTLGHRKYDETVSLLLDEHHLLKQMEVVLAPFYQQLGAEQPQAAVQFLVDLLEDAAKDAQGKLDGDKKPYTAFGYLQSLLAAKRQFLKSYEKRGVGKDFRTLTLTQLRNTKLPGAAEERFRRAVQAIMRYNDQAAAVEMMWFINASVVTDLVGGRPADAKALLEGDLAEEIEAHHQKHGLKPGFNRRALKITKRITVPEEPSPDESA